MFFTRKRQQKIFDDDFVYFARQRENFVKMRRGKATSRVSLWGRWRRTPWSDFDRSMIDGRSIESLKLGLEIRSNLTSSESENELEFYGGKSD
jgi:hypothetical protein